MRPFPRATTRAAPNLPAKIDVLPLSLTVVSIAFCLGPSSTQPLTTRLTFGLSLRRGSPAPGALAGLTRPDPAAPSSLYTFRPGVGGLARDSRGVARAFPEFTRSAVGYGSSSLPSAALKMLATHHRRRFAAVTLFVLPFFATRFHAVPKTIRSCIAPVGISPSSPAP